MTATARKVWFPAAALGLLLTVVCWTNRKPATENNSAATHLQTPATLRLTMPEGGTDYDLLEAAWVRPLPDEPSATAPARIFSVSLDSNSPPHSLTLPTGSYRLTVKSRTPQRVRDFVLNPALAIRPADNAVSLPPSLCRTYVGFAGTATDPNDGVTGLLCGLNISLQQNTGQLVMAFPPLKGGQTWRYATLRPRPDTVWPVGNLFLEDPGHLSFDCPLSYVDHRVLLLAADGLVTLLPEVIAPEDQRQQTDMLARMKLLLPAQARRSKQQPEAFDPRYLGLRIEELPNYQNLSSREQYARHLARLAKIVTRPIELGAQLNVRGESSHGWEVQVTRIYDQSVP